MKKTVIALLAVISLLFLSPKSTFADTNLNSMLDNNSVSILKELDKVTEFNDQGLPVINLEVADEIGISQEARIVAVNLNQMVNDIETNGESSALAAMERAILPLGSYGNYCGMGNNGWNVAPIDDLDSACREHDKCFKGFTKDNRACNQAFLRRLLPIIQVNGVLSNKGSYALAAYKLFANYI